MEEIEIEIVPVFSYVFALDNLPDGKYVEATVNYTRDNENRINSEVWLRSKDEKAIMFLADICSFADNGQSAEQIETRLLNYYNGSETFRDSVVALLNNHYDYFSAS